MKTNIENIKKILLSFVVAVILISDILYQQGGKAGTNSTILGNVSADSSSGFGTNQASGSQPQSQTFSNYSHTQTSNNKPNTNQSNGAYKDGYYTGTSVDAGYGNVKVAVTVSGGKITDVQFLDHPNSKGTSISINNYAMPILKSEVIQAQNARVDTVSGATYTSAAFIDSLSSALSQA